MADREGIETTRDRYDLRKVLEVYASTRTSASAGTATQTNLERKGWSPTQWRLWFFAADALGILFWSYVLLKIFVYDVDRAALDAFAPDATWILGYRLILIVAAATLIASLLWRLETIVTVSYVLLFPFVVVIWKIPRAITKRRSWTLAIASLNFAAVFARNLRYYLVSKGLLLIAAFFILTTSFQPILVVCGLIITGLLVWSYTRVITDTFQASWFLRIQSAGIQRIMSSSVIKSLFTVEQSLLDKGTDLTSTEVNGLVGKVQIAAVVNRALYSWAYRLQQYKQFQVNVLFNGLAYFLLFVQTVFTFGLLNLALLKVDASQFQYEEYPSTIAMFLYGMSSVFLADGAGVAGVGDAALLLRILAGLFGFPFLGVVAVNVLFTWRREREDTTLDDTVANLRTVARQQDAEFRSALRVSVAEACNLLRDIQSLILVEFLIRGMPPEFLEDDDAAAGASAF
jgi:hypothetical protein